ncbi:hypothetical protein GALL_344310 [mine drainage metagenome]|uniref:Winged helix-turn-helix domain-containing protein n=1 Tax=mine drainage metagenome TaxID=410659 RepID=A0A1J5QJR2_9ZZZZ
MSPERDDAANSGGSCGVKAKQSDQYANGNSRRAQQQRLLDYLRKHGSIDTVTARRELDTMMPAARIFELRHEQGYDIVSHRVRRETDYGRTHSVALYTLLGEPRQGVLL